ncbi:hypothetical protein LSUE1_G005068 [Lachnellula suecica]|uniref:Uncharacterized protein n=1 Tax=Lachnellula suecica TaxID=602035 RepID=A0A8T9BZW2_9HELO|nr:hypothetical protein LSUE1_G005068 [Lachnellula suecica]
MSPLTTPFPTTLDASSYQSPGGGALYAPLRDAIVATATAMGYDPSTMVEIGINWSDDLDPFGHVKNHAYGHFTTACNVRVFHSFETSLGTEKFDDFMHARGVGVLVRSSTTRWLRPVTFPNALIVAYHLTEVLPDRYFGITTIWSLRQQAMGAETSGYMVFFDHGKGKLADLLEMGGEFRDLYGCLVERMEREGKIAGKWEVKQSEKKEAKI